MRDEYPVTYDPTRWQELHAILWVCVKWSAVVLALGAVSYLISGDVSSYKLLGALLVGLLVRVVAGDAEGARRHQPAAEKEEGGSSTEKEALSLTPAKPSPAEKKKAEPEGPAALP